MKELNEKFMEEIQKPKTTMNKAYDVMVKWKTCRALFGFTFSHNPKPMRSKRLAVPPSETDAPGGSGPSPRRSRVTEVPDSDDSFSQVVNPD